MSALLAKLTSRGIRIEADGDRLHVRARRGTVTPADLDEIRTHRDELVAALTAPAPVVSPRSMALLVVRPDGLRAWLCTDAKAVAWADELGDGLPVITVEEVLRISTPEMVPAVLLAKKVFCGSRVVAAEEGESA